MNEQLMLWIEEKIKTIMIHKKLLSQGERPDKRPWGGRFDKEKK